MSILLSLQSLPGQWTGENALWLSETEPPRLSASRCSVAPEANGQCLALRYTWADSGKPQEGVLLLNADPESAACTAVWTDSWHYAHQLMTLRGAADAVGAASMLGAYAAPPGPDWGWRITVAPPEGDRFTLRMFNISPDGEEVLAVEALFSRLQ